MAFEEFKYQILTGLFNMAGHIISGQITKTDFEEQEKISTEYYERAKQVARADDKKQDRELKKIAEPAQSEPEAEGDLTVEKVTGGTACLPCSRDHFSTISGALNEAIRFSRREGIQHSEVQRRLGISLDELNMLERIDLASDEMVNLKGSEKKLAEWGLNKSRELRHKITTITSHDDLERVAAEASSIRTEFMRNLWNIATVDGSINKLCKGYKDEDYQRCVNTINEILSDKKRSPP